MDFSEARRIVEAAKEAGLIGLAEKPERARKVPEPKERPPKERRRVVMRPTKRQVPSGKEENPSESGDLPVVQCRQGGIREVPEVREAIEYLVMEASAMFSNYP